MRKTTQKEIKQYITTGAAQDITHRSFEELNELRNACNLETVAISAGIYGMNGALLQDRKTGQLYAITARTSSLFQMV